MEKALALLSDVFKVPRTSLTEDSTQHDIEAWDSLGHLMLVQALEQAYSITLSANEILSLSSARSIAKLLEARGLLKEA